MDLWKSSLPGRRPGSSLFRQNRKSATMIPQQVTLHLDVEPPVFETSAPKQPPVLKTVNQGTNTMKKQGGQFWHSIRTMYQTFCSGSTPVTWVNPEMVNPHPVNYNQPYFPGGQYLAMEMDKGINGGECLWYPAPPNGSQLQYVDPLQFWPQKVMPGNSVPQPMPYYTNYPSMKSKCSQPLNPEAKEWIPKELREKKENAHTPQKKISNPLKRSSNVPIRQNAIDTNVFNEYSEITEREIDAVRNVVQCIDICPVSTVSKGKQFVTKMSSGMISGDTTVINANSDVTLSTFKCIDEKMTPNSPVSYAGVARKVLSSPELPRANSPNEHHSEGVNQKLPKIFLKDKKYPKEKASPLMEKSIHKLPFKTANKVQKKNSKKFLNDLKAAAQPGSECSSLCSDTSFGSPCSDVISHSMTPKSACAPCDPQSWEKLKGLSTSPEERSAMTQCTVSENSSTGDRIRSNSESSVASVDSINIEFENELDKSNCVSNVCIISEKCQPKSIDSSKLSNSVALILGLSDCRSEDSEEEWDDSDSDWDAVDNDCMLDDGWETFGMGFTITTTCKPLSSSQKCDEENSGIGEKFQFLQSCDILDEDDDEFSYNLEAINKRWNAEIEKDISTKTDSRVSFGSVTVRPMIKWAYAYQQARRGSWEQYARDAARFSRRIADLEATISPVLQEKHRQKVYQKLYGVSS